MHAHTHTDRHACVHTHTRRHTNTVSSLLLIKYNSQRATVSWEGSLVLQNAAPLPHTLALSGRSLRTVWTRRRGRIGIRRMSWLSRARGMEGERENEAAVGGECVVDPHACLPFSGVRRVGVAEPALASLQTLHHVSARGGSRLGTPASREKAAVAGSCLPMRPSTSGLPRYGNSFSPSHMEPDLAVCHYPNSRYPWLYLWVGQALPGLPLDSPALLWLCIGFIINSEREGWPPSSSSLHSPCREISSWKMAWLECRL